jgi:hypothetical protein
VIAKSRIALSKINRSAPLPNRSTNRARFENEHRLGREPEGKNTSGTPKPQSRGTSTLAGVVSSSTKNHQFLEDFVAAGDPLSGSGRPSSHTFLARQISERKIYTSSTISAPSMVT